MYERVLHYIVFISVYINVLSDTRRGTPTNTRTPARTHVQAHSCTHALTVFEVLVVTHDFPGAATVAQVVVDAGSLVVVQCEIITRVVVTERPHLTRQRHVRRMYPYAIEAHTVYLCLCLKIHININVKLAL